MCSLFITELAKLWGQICSFKTILIYYAQKNSSVSFNLDLAVFKTTTKTKKHWPAQKKILALTIIHKDEPTYTASLSYPLYLLPLCPKS